MQKNRFWVEFLGFTLFVFGLIQVFSYYKSEWVSDIYWVILGFFVLISLIAHFVAQIGVKNREDFHMYYFVSMGIRFFISLFFIVLSAILLQDGRVTYVLNFFVIYILYTSFEIYHLIRNLRPDSGKDGLKNQ